MIENNILKIKIISKTHLKTLKKKISMIFHVSKHIFVLENIRKLFLKIILKMRTVF